MSEISGFSEKQNLFFVRLCIWSGFVYLVGVIIGWAIIAGFVPPPPAYWTAEQFSNFYTQNSFSIRLGLIITIFFQPLYFVWAAGIAKVMSRILKIG